MQKKIICLLFVIISWLLGTFLPINAMTLQDQLIKTKDSLGKLHTNLKTLKDELVELKDNLQGKKTVPGGPTPEDLEEITAFGFTEKGDLGAPFKSTEGFNKGINDLIDRAIEALPESLTIAKTLKLPYAYNPTNLKDYAETRGFGYKTGNLQQLENLEAIFRVLRELVYAKSDPKILPYKVQVPEFIGISSANITAFLNNKGVDINARWNTIKTKYAGQAKNFFENGKTFSDAFLKDLKDLEDDVVAVFNNEAATAQAGYNFNTIFNTAGVKEKITKITDARQSMIIRSTGKEDTDKLANAGGNESVPNVSPHPSDILQAMGIVVGSYFSKKSFGQRLSGTTEISQVTELINEDPFIPVLIQRMIGERIQGIRDENIKKFFKTKNNTIQIKSDGSIHTLSKQKVKVVLQELINNMQVQKDFAENFSFNDTFFTAESEIDELVIDNAKLGINIVIQSTTDESNNYTVNPQATVANTKKEVLKGIREVIGIDLDNNAHYFALKIYPEVSLISDTEFEVSTVLEKTLKGAARGAKLNRDLLHITSCGVMFTEEAEGGLARLDPKRVEKAEKGELIKTSGITKLDASYGHNEGVVNSLVGVDTYYLDQFGVVHQVIRPKKFRKFPSLQEGKKLEDLNNPQILVNKPALDAQELFTLKLIANVLEAYYKKPMDAEFVVDHFNGVIYLVQARPITNKEDQAEPSYLKDMKNTGKQFAGVSIGAAGGALRLITSPNQAIVDNSINLALDAFLKSINKEKIESVIIGKDAPGTSHEATTFRTEGKPVTWVKSGLKSIIEFIEQGQPLLVDVQQELVMAWNGQQKTIKELMDSKVAGKGWAKYPLQLSLSLMPGDEVMSDEEFKEILNLLGLSDKITYAAIETAAIELNKNFTKKAKEHLFDANDSDKTIRQLAIIFVGVARLIELYNQSTTVTAEQQKNLLIIQNHMLKTMRSIIGTLDEISEPDKEKRELKRRYYLRFLEALIFQQPGTVINGYSLYGTVLQEIRLEQETAKQLATTGGVTAQEITNALTTMLHAAQAEYPKLNITNQQMFNAMNDFATKVSGNAQNAIKFMAEPLRAVGIPEDAIIENVMNVSKDIGVYYLTYIKPLGFSTEVQNNWQTFITNQLKNASQKNRKEFAAMMLNLGKIKVLPIWLNTSFNIEFKKNAHNALTVLLNEYNTINNFIVELLEKQEKIAQIDTATFADETTFKKVWPELKLIITYFTDNQFKNDYTSSTDLGKAIALNIMEEFVDKFDLSIKGLKGRSYKTKKKKSGTDEFEDVIDAKKLQSLLVDWKDMLTKYLDVLDKWIDFNAFFGSTNFGAYGKTPREKISSGSYAHGVISTLNSINTTVSDFDKVTKEKEVYNSQKFDASGASVGSGAEWGEIHPVTLEDIFSFIHQSLLDTTSYLLNATSIKDIAKPTLLVEIIDSLTPFKQDNFKGVAAGIHTQLNDKKLDNDPVGMDVKANTLTYKYNYKLRSHSAKINITYSQKESMQQCTITLIAAGNNEFARWEKTGDLGAWLCECCGLEIQDGVKDPYETQLSKKSVSFSFIVTPNNKTQLTHTKSFDKIPQILFALLDMSYSIMSEISGTKYEKEIYENATSAPIPSRFGFTINNQSFVDKILKLSRIGTRAHSTIRLAFEKMPNDQVLYGNAIEVLGKLALEHSSYASKSDLLFFKKYTTPAYGSPDLGEDYYLLDAALFSGDKKWSDYSTKTNAGMYVIQDEINKYKQKLFKDLLTEFFNKPNILDQLSDDNLQALLNVLASNLELILTIPSGFMTQYNNSILPTLNKSISKPSLKNNAIRLVKQLVAYGDLKGKLPYNGTSTITKGYFNAHLIGNLENWKEALAIELPEQFILLPDAFTKFNTLYTNASTTQKVELLKAAKTMVTKGQELKKSVDSKEITQLVNLLQSTGQSVGDISTTLLQDALADQDKALNDINFVNNMITIYKNDTSANKTDSIKCINTLAQKGFDSSKADWIIKALELTSKAELKTVPAINKITMDSVTDKLKDETPAVEDFLTGDDASVLTGFLDRLTAIDSGKTDDFKTDIGNLSELWSSYVTLATLL